MRRTIRSGSLCSSDTMYPATYGRSEWKAICSRTMAGIFSSTVRAGSARIPKILGTISPSARSKIASASAALVPK